jgi:hypothetical protein
MLLLLLLIQHFRLILDLLQLRHPMFELIPM